VYSICHNPNLCAHNKRYMDDYYQAPWIRVAPFTIGILLGMALRDTCLAKLRLSDTSATAAMFLCVGTIVSLFYIQVRL
jgi:hypothetical protein